MKTVVRALLFLALLLAGPVTAGAQTRFFLGGGPTGTSDHGFRGGWGGTLGLEHRIGVGGAFLVRAEAGAVPASSNGSGAHIFFSDLAGGLGQSGPRSRDATLLSLMAGVRLGGSDRFAPYLDAMVGVGYLNDPTSTAGVYPALYPTPPAPSNEHANIALSLGPGFAFRTPYGPALFADVHYDFLFVEGATTPLIPVRFGLLVP